MDNLNELLRMVVPREWLFSVMPVGASSHAHQIDYLYWFLIISCTILFLLLVVPMIWFVFKYRRKSPNQRATSQKDHNVWLEASWTFLPFIYLAVLFVWGFWQYMDMYVAPHDSKELKVMGQKWNWSVDYPEEGINVSGLGAEIAVPADIPIKLVMTSQDVIHSFYVPNLRVKQDVVPGRYSTLWFQANQVGVYPILCAEYCGNLHSQMFAKLLVLPRPAYDKWIEDRKAADNGLPPAELGKKLYSRKGCVACHTVDGNKHIGPSFKDLWGKSEEFEKGPSQIIDDKFIMNKLLNPQSTIAKGYVAPGAPSPMPKVAITANEIAAISAYIKSLSNKNDEN